MPAWNEWLDKPAPISQANKRNIVIFSCATPSTVRADRACCGVAPAKCWRQRRLKSPVLRGRKLLGTWAHHSRGLRGEFLDNLLVDKAPGVREVAWGGRCSDQSCFSCWCPGCRNHILQAASTTWDRSCPIPSTSPEKSGSVFLSPTPRQALMASDAIPVYQEAKSDGSPQRQNQTSAVGLKNLPDFLLHSDFRTNTLKYGRRTELHSELAVVVVGWFWLFFCNILFCLWLRWRNTFVSVPAMLFCGDFLFQSQIFLHDIYI